MNTNLIRPGLAAHLAETVEGMTPWFLQGSDDMWFRLADLADRAGVGRPAMRKMLQRCEQQGVVEPSDVRRGVRSDEVAELGGSMMEPLNNQGETLVTFSASEILLARCEGEAASPSGAAMKPASSARGMTNAPCRTKLCSANS